MFFLTGLAYFYYPGLIVIINKWMRKIFFNDARVLYNRKKTGMIYVLVSLVVFYGAYTIKALPSDHSVKGGLYQAWCCYYQGEYAHAREISERVLQEDPENLVAMEQLMLVYFVQNDYRKADYYCTRILSKSPGNKRTKNMCATIQNKMKNAPKVSVNYFYSTIREIIS